MIELSKVKHILRFMIFVAYNSVLEKAFIMDEFGTPYGIENGKGEEMGEREEGHEEEEIEGAVGGEGIVVGLESKCLDNDYLKATLKEEEIKFKEERGNEKTHEEGKVVNRELFEKVMSNVILCSSPLITYPVPYILTNEGQRCQLLTYMEENPYWSPLFNDDIPEEDGSSEVDHLDSVKEPESKSVFMRETHPFIFAVLTKNARDLEARALLAHFRADGGRIVRRKRQNDASDEEKVEVRQNGFDDTDGIWKSAGGMETGGVLSGQNYSNEPTDEELQNTSPLMVRCELSWWLLKFV